MMENTKPSGPRVVVVTGASAGVGRAIAREFGSRGDSIGLIARGRAGLEAAKRDAEECGGRAIAIPLDVSDHDALFDAARRVEQELGPIDVWVNCAMVSVFSPVKEMQAEEFRRVAEVTYLGTVYGTLAALRSMLPRNEGIIIQIGSALAYRGIPLQSAYCAAKHAVQGFNDSLRCELIHDDSRVRLTSIELPAINTPQFDWVRSRLPHKAQPVPPIYQPEVVARAVAWAAERERREILLGFSTVKAVEANKVAPGLLDRYLARHGYESQQTPEPRDPDTPDNLFRPLDDEVDHGAHGRFDDRARERSTEFWIERCWGELGFVGAGLLLAAGLGAMLASRRG